MSAEETSQVETTSPGEAGGAAISNADGVLIRDCPCVHCGYNLRSLQRDGVCPECGSNIRTTLMATHETDARSTDRMVTTFELLSFQVATLTIGMLGMGAGPVLAVISDVDPAGIACIFAVIMLACFLSTIAVIIGIAIAPDRRIPRLRRGKYALLGSSGLVLVGIVLLSTGSMWPAVTGLALLASGIASVPYGIAICCAAIAEQYARSHAQALKSGGVCGTLSLLVLGLAFASQPLERTIILVPLAIVGAGLMGVHCYLMRKHLPGLRDALRAHVVACTHASEREANNAW